MARHATRCVHRWILGHPSFATVRGFCRRCGARRVFPSGLEMPEAPVSEEELAAASEPLFVAEPASAEEHAFV